MVPVTTNQLLSYQTTTNFASQAMISERLGMPLGDAAWGCRWVKLRRPACSAGIRPASLDAGENHQQMTVLSVLSNGILPCLSNLRRGSQILALNRSDFNQRARYGISPTSNVRLPT